MRKESFTGEKVGKLHVEKLVKEGSSARVYTAYSKQQDKNYALRVLSPREGGVHLERFETARDMLTIYRSTPGIASLHDSGIKEIAGEEYPYLVMDFAEHGSITDYLGTHGELPVSEIMKNFVPGSAHALQSVHDEGMVHQVVKPEHYLVDSDGEMLRYELSNFDLAGYPHVEKEYVIGAPSYMAPEKMLEGNISQSGDRYSYGATLFRLLVGQPPYKELDSPEDFIVAHTQGWPPFYREHLRQSKFPDPGMNSVRGKLVGKVVETVLMPDPEDRPKNLEGFAHDLIDFYEEEKPNPLYTTLMDLTRKKR